MRVEICDVCNGTGELKFDTREGYSSEKCKKCNGYGRILTRTYSYQVPFNTNVQLIYPVDSQIIQLINKLEKESRL